MKKIKLIHKFWILSQIAKLLKRWVHLWTIPWAKEPSCVNLTLNNKGFCDVNIKKSLFLFPTLSLVLFRGCSFSSHFGLKFRQSHDLSGYSWIRKIPMVASNYTHLLSSDTKSIQLMNTSWSKVKSLFLALPLPLPAPPAGVSEVWYLYMGLCFLILSSHPLSALC